MSSFKPMPLLKMFLLVLLGSTAFARTDVIKKPAPAWVKEITVTNDEVVNGSGAYQYLLIDNQENLKKQEVFRHYAIKIMNSEGIQAMSDIVVNYDPTYQKVSFHSVRIIRGDKVIDKLQQTNIETFQRETSMERSLYDGSLSAVLNLVDVRENDVIEYSYSISGFNPIHKGNYSTGFYHQFSTPVNRIFNRVLTEANKKLNYKLFEGASEPTIVKSKGLKEYIWDLSALDYKLSDSNVPIWFDPYRRVSLSTFESWKAVVDWGVPLYSYSESEMEDIQSSGESFSKESKILESIKLVQDDIRYLGFESGIGAYKPHSPAKVYNQRYGDCKDKSLLLIALLRSEGIPAYPLLVNTTLKGKINDQLPSNTVFDHCVVNFVYEEKNYFIDPTIGNQGGSLENIYFPDYQAGLLLKAGTSELLTIPENDKATVNIKELIDVDSINGSAKLTVRTEYTGSKADYLRSYFSSNSKEFIQKEYLNYYSNLYPSIASDDVIKFYDYERSTSNKVIVEEFYQIEKFWHNSDDGTYIYCEIYPLLLESQINYDKTSVRTMPYNLGSPFKFTQNTQLILPEEWSIQESNKVIEGEGFVYANKIQGRGNTVSVSHSYELTKEFVPAESTSSLLKKHRDIQNQLAYYITYNPELAGFNLSWISILLALIAVGGGIFICRKIYFKYNPKPWIYAENKPIESWLILPAIGITLAPIMLGTQIVNEAHFNQNTWKSILSPETLHSTSMALLIGAEILYNFSFFVFTIFVAISFYLRRTCVPRLISIYYVLNFSVPVLNLVVANEMGINTNSASPTNMIGSFVGAAIWIPYFNISERAKSTFCKTAKVADGTASDPSSRRDISSG